MSSLKQINKLLILCLVFLLVQPAFGQSREELERQMEQLKKDIDFTENQLKKMKESSAISSHELSIIKAKIRKRAQLIANISEQIKLLDDHIQETNDVIKALQNDLAALKEEYAKMILYSYKHHSAYNKLLFLFSANSFNDAYYRMKYMQRYAEFRKKQAELIQFTQLDLQDKVDTLKKRKDQKKELLNVESNQKKEYEREKQEKDMVVSKLKKEVDQLKTELRKQEKNKEKLNKAIEDIILAESKKGGLQRTPEVERLSADFASNRGKLPWPVEHGVITGTFGEHAHEILPKIKVRNNGIDIETNPGAHARALFEGQVANIVFNPGFHKAVIIRHGDYFTVYSNLNDVYVKPGDKVTVKQNIGVVYTDDGGSKTEIHLEVWKGTSKMDPEKWIYKR